jgi:hypothetical protein
VIRTALVGGSLLLAVVVAVVVGVFAYHSDAANRAQGAPAEATVNAAFEEAERSWRRNIDWPPVHRLVLTSAEEYGTGIYLFVFDMYYWFGIGSGYMTFGSESQGTQTRATACSDGGIVRDGGLAGVAERGSDRGLLEARAGCTRAYGAGRVVAPTAR